MAELGKSGGLAGGPARARALSPLRRSAIARTAARTRWSGPVLSGGGSLDLVALVAHGGSSVSPGPPPPRLEVQALRALRAARRDSALARMLPVFLWRMRDQLDLAELVTLAIRQGQASSLGFFLEAAGRLAGSRRFDRVLIRLRSAKGPARPRYFFLGTMTRPFERAAADRATPELARRWGLLMNMPWDSFESHFEKAAHL